MFSQSRQLSTDLLDVSKPTASSAFVEAELLRCIAGREQRELLGPVGCRTWAGLT